MAFDLEKLLKDVFAPREGEVLTVMYDLPHGRIQDTGEWQARREMAESWRRGFEEMAPRYGLSVNAGVTYKATGTHNGDLPEEGICNGKTVLLEEIIKSSTILISMTQYSASAPLVIFAKRYGRLRVASMPTVSRSMEETALSADYARLAATCARLAPLFEKAVGMEVAFSTGHTCYFDISDNKTIHQDNGLLHPDAGEEAFRIRNLPSGEVCVCPNEAEDSRTAGEIPASLGGETVILTVEKNRITGVKGDGLMAKKLRGDFLEEPALLNIAEVAIGCNEKAVVTGNVLEDEKAGFHWAYGRSDHLGGMVGPWEFSSPERVLHRDIVYAKGSPILCKRLDFVFPDGTMKTAIVDGELRI